MSIRFLRAQPIPRHSRALLAGLSLAFLASCGEDKKGGESVESGATRVVEVCGAQLTCGDECVADSSCPDGQFCDDGGKCYAECTAQTGCMGECDARGRCEGQRQIVVEGPGMNEDGPILVGDDDSSSGPITSGDGTSFEGCATDSASGELTPVALYVMFDRSSSMEGEKWTQATDALRAFYRDPASADLNVAHAVFPSEVNGCNDPDCDATACSDPVVSIGTLSAEAAPNDAHEAALIAAIDGDQPGNGDGRTPTFPALAGSLQWAESYQGQNPSSAVVVVLVTDGEATGCNTDTQAIAGLAADSLDGAGIRTYVIGLEGSSENQIDQIAAAGGTGDGIFIGGGGDAGQQLLDALGQIRGDVASCDLQMPRPATGTVDPTKVNVEVTLSSGAVPLAQVGGGDECNDVAGWHYNDNNDPTRIQLCPVTCDAVQGDPAARIDIVLGCETNLIPPQLAR